ncbi:methionine--tRNA ligase [Candidatus Gottesmanbacteria bacterium]|nr:methionine--tRNA ligase [Candidatus Gottesmanbacteria bacterium]
MVKDVVSFSDFQKLDLRVGKVIKAEAVEGSRNLVRMNVDLGSDYGVQKILAGIGEWYKQKDVKGKKFIFVANLAPKQMMREMSSGMILCADIDEKAVVIPVDKKIPEGAIVR